MRYKLLGLAVVLLISTPSVVSAQKMSPIIVKTGKPVPSVVRSGEPFKITYQVTYTDAVLIIEEQMRLNSLTLVKADEKNKPKSALAEPETSNIEAEVVDLVIEEKVRDGSYEMGFLNVQDFTYTFVVINEQKGNYKIPSFNFVWVEKEAGATVAEAKDREELKEFSTKEVGISYVTSIVRPPTVDIRDAARFYNFETLAGRALFLAYGTIGLASLLALITVARFYRQPKDQKADGGKDAVENINEDVVDAAMPVLSLRKARKRFLLGLKTLESELMFAGANEETANVAVSKLYQLVRPFILGELSGGTVRVSDAHTPKEMCEYLAGLNGKQSKQLGRKYAAILELVYRSKNYYESMESDGRFADPEKEVSELMHIVENIDHRNKLYSLTRSFIRKAHSFVKSRFLRR